MTPIYFLFLSWTHTIIRCCGWLSTESSYSATFARGSRELLVAECVPLLFFVNGSCEIHNGSGLLWHEHKMQAPHWLPVSGHRNCNALLQLCATLLPCSYPAGLLCVYRQFRCPTFEKHPCYCTAGSVGLPFLCELVRGRQQEKSRDGAGWKGVLNPPGLIYRAVFARPTCLAGSHDFNVLGGSVVCYGVGGSWLWACT